MGDTRANDSLERGIETAKAGNKLLARLHLLQAVELAPRDPNCWLWLAWVAESPASAIHSLQRVLDEHPRHELALLGLRWAKAMAEFDLYAEPSVSEESEPAPTQPQESTEAGSSFDDGEESSAFGGRQSGHEQYKNDGGEQPESPEVKSAHSTDEDAVPEDAVSTQRDDRENWVVLERQDSSRERSDRFEEDEAASDARSDEPHANKNGSFASEGQADASSESNEHDPKVETNASDETVEAAGWWQRSGSNATQNTFAEPEREEEKAEASEVSPAPTGTSYAAAAEVTESDEEPATAKSSAQDFSADDDDVLPGEEQESDQGLSVLVVDDSPTVRKLVTMTLEKNGFTVASAPDGVVALKSIAELKPRLILLDINMPRLGGYQLCKLIKKHESTKHIPVIMLSGKDGMFDKVRGKFVGCDDYITKPFDPDVLVEKVSTQLTAHYGIAGSRT